eukprot:gene6595-9405_t
MSSSSSTTTSGGGGGGSVGRIQGGEAPWPFIWFDNAWKQAAKEPILRHIHAGERPWIEVIFMSLFGAVVLYFIIAQVLEFYQSLNVKDGHSKAATSSSTTESQIYESVNPSLGHKEKVA